MRRPYKEIEVSPEMEAQLMGRGSMGVKQYAIQDGALEIRALVNLVPLGWWYNWATSQPEPLVSVQISMIVLNHKSRPFAVRRPLDDEMRRACAALYPTFSFQETDPSLMGGIAIGRIDDQIESRFVVYMPGGLPPCFTM